MSGKEMHADPAAFWLGDRPRDQGTKDRSPDPLSEALDELFLEGPTAAAIKHAVNQLKAVLAAEDLVYGLLTHSPIGPVYVALSKDGLAAVDFGVSERRFLARLIREHGVEPARDDARTRAYLAQLEEYLAGERRSFDLPVDLSKRTDFQRLVLEAASRVPCGELATYGEIARWIGRPRAARAVGQALARNPVPIVIPCHRVVAADGSLTGYSGGRGIETKEALLRLEGALTN